MKYICFHENVLTHSYPNFNGGLAKPPLKLHGDMDV